MKKDNNREKVYYQMTCQSFFGDDFKLIADKDLSGNKDFVKAFGLKNVVDPKPFTSLSEIEIGLNDFYFDNTTVVPITKGKFSLDNVSRHSNKEQENEKKEVWLKGVLEENGDVLIHLGNDGYQRIPNEYLDELIVNQTKTGRN